jgi:hypothetical protein
MYLYKLINRKLSSASNFVSYTAAPHQFEGFLKTIKTIKTMNEENTLEMKLVGEIANDFQELVKKYIEQDPFIFILTSQIELTSLTIKALDKDTTRLFLTSAIEARLHDE